MSNEGCTLMILATFLASWTAFGMFGLTFDGYYYSNFIGHHYIYVFSEQYQNIISNFPTPTQKKTPTIQPQIQIQKPTHTKQFQQIQKILQFRQTNNEKMYLKQAQQQKPSMKLIKCRSHDNLIHPINTDRSISTQQQIGTRPKFQSIRSKNQYENQPFIWWKSDGCVGDGDCEVRNGRNGGLGRVRSVDKFQSVRETQQYENIVQAYKQQNSNLKKQNKYLQNQIKKRLKNEQTLTNYITHLQQQIKKLDIQSRTRQSTTPPITSRSKNKPPLPLSIPNTIKSYKNDLIPLLNSKVGIDEGDTCNTMEEIQQLNQRFNALMEQCSKEDCRRNRHVIREKLAETAERMRVFRREFGDG